MKRRLMMGLASAGLVAALSAGTALAGEVKGPPTGGDSSLNVYNHAALYHANSACVFSGLNDYVQGQTDKQTQTPADGSPGAAGHGDAMFPIGCRGGSNPDRGVEQ